MHLRLTAPVLTLALAACASASQDTAVAPSGGSAGEYAQLPGEVQPTAHQDEPAGTALNELFAQSDEAMLKRNPLQALVRGDLRYADQFGDYISDEYFAAERAAAEADLAALARVDRSSLTPEQQVTYDTFRWQREMALRGLQPDLLALTVVQPVDHFRGYHTFFPDISSGGSIAPFNTLADYENNLKRIRGFAAIGDKAIARFREGLAAGVTQPRLVTRNVVEQLDTLIAQGVEDSPFYRPLNKFPDAVPQADRERLRREYAQVLREEVIPSYTRLRDYLRDEYLPRAREGVGLVHMKGGPELYRYLVQEQTTTEMAPEQIHQLGLSEVARIKSAMEAVKREVGFNGTLQQFFEHIRTDPKFKPKSAEELAQGYQAIEKRVEAALPRLFTQVPEAPLRIEPVPEFLEKNQAGAYYRPPTPDGARPGVFYFNTYDLPSRTTPGMETLYLHEGEPGHHFQISLAIEDESLPSFQRFGGNTAFVEGWALYAESLGPELGLFTDPYQRFGHLDDEMLRAMRLVVDTGLHHKGWTRDQAIQYMLDNSSMGKTDATAEVERYIAMPGQALAYKIGQLKIRELRTEAERALGDRFDIREFHAQVLGSGALPLNVLEAKIDRWIASQRQA